MRSVTADLGGGTVAEKLATWRAGLPGLLGGLALLAVAFLPPVTAAAVTSANVHFAQHVLILLAGLVGALGVVAPRDWSPGSGLARVMPAIGLAALGVALYLGSQLPAFDAIADQSMPVHVLQHLVILLAGGLQATGFVGLVRSSPAGTSRPS